MTSMENSEVLIRIQATPNPNAWKFVLDKPVLNDDKATYSTIDEAYGNPLATDLMTIDGVKQVHLFGNVITVTHRFDSDPEQIQKETCKVIHARMPTHNPDFGKKDSREAKRKELPEELQRIEEVLDRTIRPGLQGDGGDLEVIKLEDNKLYVLYQGACGTCPSATSGTLMAIEGILREELGQQLEVIPV